MVFDDYNDFKIYLKKQKKIWVTNDEVVILGQDDKYYQLIHDYRDYVATLLKEMREEKINEILK